MFLCHLEQETYNLNIWKIGLLLSKDLLVSVVQNRKRGHTALVLYPEGNKLCVQTKVKASVAANSFSNCWTLTRLGTNCFVASLLVTVHPNTNACASFSGLHNRYANITAISSVLKTAAKTPLLHDSCMFLLFQTKLKPKEVRVLSSLFQKLEKQSFFVILLFHDYPPPNLWQYVSLNWHRLYYVFPLMRTFPANGYRASKSKS